MVYFKPYTRPKRQASVWSDLSLEVDDEAPITVTPVRPRDWSTLDAARNGATPKPAMRPRLPVVMKTPPWADSVDADMSASPADVGTKPASSSGGDHFYAKLRKMEEEREERQLLSDQMHVNAQQQMDDLRKDVDTKMGHLLDSMDGISQDMEQRHNQMNHRMEGIAEQLAQLLAVIPNASPIADNAWQAQGWNATNAWSGSWGDHQSASGAWDNGAGGDMDDGNERKRKNLDDDADSDRERTPRGSRRAVTGA
jgi:hypothetical protein